MAATFSDRAWSGTPMWQIQGQLDERKSKRDAEERRKASTPVAVLNIGVEGEDYVSVLTLLIPSKAALPAESRPDPSSGGFREVKVRGPRRRKRREALQDGFDLRAGFHNGGEAEVHRRLRELQARTWAEGELPAEDAPVEEPEDQEQRLRLAQRPRGTGWSRQKDKQFFVHTVSPMAYDPKKMQYFSIDPSTQQYVPSDPPHDPNEYPIGVLAGASLVARDDSELTAPERPRSLLLKELVLTGRAMKKPLFFLDQPASCFALFESVRGTSAVDYCSKNFHTKLLAKLSSSLQFWSDTMLKRLVSSLLDELDAELLQQPATCYNGASAGIALLMGDRLLVATLGRVRGLLFSPDGTFTVVGDHHAVAKEGAERRRLDAAFCEVMSQDDGALRVQRPQPRRQTIMAQEAIAEIQRVLDCAPDSFAVLGFGKDDTLDSKAAKTHYRKLALKVHPDKAPQEWKEKANLAFAKVESALAQLEALYDTDAEGTAALHNILEASGDVASAGYSRSWAREVLGIDEDTSIEDAEKKAVALRKPLEKLGLFADGQLGQPDAARAGRLLEEAVEVLRAPVPASEGALAPVAVSRALGLRDLKRPRPILSATPHFNSVQLTTPGSHRLVLLSDATGALSDQEIATRVFQLPRQPKAASMLVATDASRRRSAQESADAASCLASSIVAVFEVAAASMEEPPTKKARTDQVDKVRCLHILLKHRDLRLTKDVRSQQRLKGKPVVTRTQAQAERELLEMQQALLANPNVFHVLARKHSECDTALQPGQSAGDLGWVAPGTWDDPPFEAAMFNLKVNEVSDIISTARGLHILQRIA